MTSALKQFASQELLLAARGTDDSQPRVSQLVVLAAYGPPQTQFGRSPQLQLLVARAGEEGQVVVRSSQLQLLVAYGTGIPQQSRSDAWPYTLDGHSFYVLPLGPEGDWAYDAVTRQWAQLQTQGFAGLNFCHGVMWGQRIFGGDLLYPALYELDPNQPQDEGFRPVIHVVTGAVATRSPNLVGCANFRLTASAGALSDPTTVVSLEFSDNSGNDFIGPFDISMAAGAADQPLLWSALGSFGAPGRIFRVTDSGGMLSIYGADTALNNYDEDGNEATGGGGG